MISKGALYTNVSYTDLPPDACPLCEGPLLIIDNPNYDIGRNDDSFFAVCELTIKDRSYYKHSSHYRFVSNRTDRRTFESFIKGNAKISITQYSGYRNESLLTIEFNKKTKYLKTWSKIIELKEIKDLLFKYSGVGALS